MSSDALGGDAGHATFITTVLLLTGALVLGGCATAPTVTASAPDQPADSRPSPDDFDVFVEITADAVRVDGAQVATHDASRFDADVERRGFAGLELVAVASAVREAARGAPKPASLALVVDPVVSARIVTTVIYSAPGSLSLRSYALAVGDAPPVAVEMADLVRQMHQENLPAPPFLTLSPTWRAVRLAAFMKVAEVGECTEAGTCDALAQRRKDWTGQARRATRQHQRERSRALLDQLTASYDFQRVHAGLRAAASRARKLNGHQPRYLQVSLSGDLPASLYPELFALRCANWSPTFVDHAARMGKWDCDAMADTLVVNIVR